jgi:thiosulfate reductase cytochrome b subunit
MAAGAGARSRERQWIRRYSLIVRVSHWMNVLCLGVLLMSGLQIFNAHPALYWGEDSDFDRPVLAIGTVFTADGRPIGVTRVFGWTFDTTGVLGRSRFNGRPAQRAFPAWLTIPAAQDLATGRVWHFFFGWLFVANGALFVGHSFVSRHFWRDLLPRRDQWRTFASTIRHHAVLRVHPSSGDYNVVQRVTYVFVILILAPLIVLTGLTMSPGVVAAVPSLLDVFGGRQSARTLHFIATALFVVFAIVHVVMVVLTGVFNNMRSMTTGWYGITDGRSVDDAR